jgi:hypothetical protein
MTVSRGRMPKTKGLKKTDNEFLKAQVFGSGRWRKSKAAGAKTGSDG